MSKRCDHLTLLRSAHTFHLCIFLWILEQTISFPYTALAERFYNQEAEWLRARHEPNL
jgi:hypothetical protein